MSRPVTNDCLDALLAEAGYDPGHAAFARQVNLAGRHHGSYRYDATSVYWWLRGRRPDHDVQTAMTEVLARKLGRPVRVDELGFADVNPRLGLTYPPDVDTAVHTTTDLWRVLVHRRDVLVGVPFVAAAAIEAAVGWRYDPRDADLARTAGQRVTTGDVAALRIWVDQFIDLDRRHGGGGGHARASLAEFLHRQVAPMLHGTYTDPVGRELLAGAATLTGQLAFMCYDAGDFGMAERYYIAGLRLAKAGDDQLYGAHLLANMATQAVFLGQPRTAVRLARAAVDGAGRAPAAVLARLYTAEACAHAVAGDKASCTAALRRAERAVGRTTPGDGPPWAGYFTPAHFAGTALRCFRDLGLHSQALRHADAALDLQPSGVRTRVLHTALIATTHQAAGNLDAAAEHGIQALDQAQHVHSRRVRDRLRALGQQFSSHAGTASVATYLERLQALPDSA